MRYVLAVHSNPVEGKDAEYNDWYDNVHLSEVLEVEGFVAAQRFKVTGEVEPVSGGTPSHRYLAIYEVETDNPQLPLDALAQAVGGGMTMSDAIDTTDISACLYGAITERVTA